MSHNSVATEADGKANGIQYSLGDIEGITEKSYNHHGWAKVNDVLSDRELSDFQSKVGDKARTGESWYMNLGNGRHMFAVGVDGVNSTLIISDGNFQHPSIDNVYHIGLDNETDIEIVRDVIYESERKSEWTLPSAVIEAYYGNEVIRAYSNYDFESFQTLRGEYEGAESKGNSKSSRNMQNRTGSNSKTRIEFSISEDSKMSSGDGIFFDEKNIAKNREYSTPSVREKPIAPIKNGIYTEDVALEKPIAPTDHLGEANGMVQEKVASITEKS